jgi:hypothetical protein
MKAYFFVITPANYLGALQASRDPRFNFSEKILVVLSDYHRSLIQFNSIIKEEEWNVIYYPWKNLDRRNKSKWQLILLNWKRLLTFNKLKNLIGPNDIIFWGNLNHSFFKKIENRCHDIYLIDDGFSTINILPKLEERFLNSTKKKGSTIHLYTLFQLNSTFLIIFNHQFNQIKSLEKHIAKEKSFFFIGQPLVFNNIVSEHYYVQTIQTIFTDYEKIGFSCFYLPHRSTTRDYIPSNWKTLEFDYPVEYCAELGGFQPEIFSTFYSTGVYNLEKYLSLDMKQVEFWRLDEKEISMNYKKPIESIYSYLTINNYELKNCNTLLSYSSDDK